MFSINETKGREVAPAVLLCYVLDYVSTTPFIHLTPMPGNTGEVSSRGKQAAGSSTSQDFSQEPREITRYFPENREISEDINPHREAICC